MPLSKSDWDLLVSIRPKLINEAHVVQKDLVTWLVTNNVLTWDDYEVIEAPALTPPGKSYSKKDRRRTLFTPGSGSTKGVMSGSRFAPPIRVLNPLHTHREEVGEGDEETEELTDADISVEFRKLEDLNVELESKLDEQENQRLKQDTELNTLRSMLDEKETQIGQIRKEAERRERDLCNQLAGCQQQLLSVQNEAETSTKLATELESKLANVESRLSAAENDKVELEETVSSDLAHLEDERCRIETELSECRKDAARSEEENQALQCEIAKVKAQAEFFEEQIQDWEKLCKQKEKELEQYESQTKTPTVTDAQVKALRVELEESKAKCKQLEYSVKTKSENADYFITLHNQSIFREKELKAKVEQLQSEKDCAESEKKGALNKIESLNEENENLRQENEQLSNDLQSDKNEKQQHLQDEMEKLQTDADSEKTSLACQLATVKKELEIKIRKLDSSERRASSAENKGQRLDAVEKICEKLSEKMDTMIQLVSETRPKAGLSTEESRPDLETN